MNDRALRLLEQYDLELISARRGRGSYILDTTGGLRIFSDYSNSENKAAFQNLVMERLCEGGYHRVDRILPDKEGNLIVRDWENNRYVVKEWYPGRECDTSNEHEIMAAVSNLARIHRLMQVTPGEKITAGKNGESGKGRESGYGTACRNDAGVIKSAEIGESKGLRYGTEDREGSEFRHGAEAEKNVEKRECRQADLDDSDGQNLECMYDFEPQIIYMQTPDPLKEMRSQNAELRKIRTFIRKRNDKGQFERQFLQSFDRYYVQAEEAERCLEDIQIPLRKEWEQHPGSVCHGDYDHHNILMSGYEIATINFNRCKIDFQVNDLYRFMRKILEKQEWNLRLAVRMLDGYMKVRPLPEAERKLLYAKMTYPEKFRKLANYYYGSNKAWISRRFLDKLEAIDRQDAVRREFVRKFRLQG